METYNYVEFVKGGFQHSKGNNNFITQMNDVKDYEGLTDCFISAFRFSKDFLNYFETTKTISGYGGDISLNTILFDFDSEDNIELAKQDLINFLQYGIGEFIDFEEIENFIKIHFSGCKGFSLGIPAEFLGNIKPAKDLNNRVKEFVKRLSDLTKDNTGTELKTLDYAIYDKIRLFRLHNTINSKSGLYKIPLLYSELLNLSIEEIKELATEKRYIEMRPTKEINLNPGLSEIFNSINLYEPKKTETTNENKKDFIFSFEPVLKGERNKRLFENAGYLRYKNISFDTAKEILTVWNNNKLPEPIEQTEFIKTLKSAFRYDTKEDHKEDNNIFEFQNYEKRLEAYQQYVKDIDKRKIKIGFPIIDTLIRGLRPGNVMTILAGTGIGKSMIAQNILHNYTNETKELTIFFSLEMSIEEILERELQMEFKMKGFDIERSFLQNDKSFIERCKAIINEHNNFITVDKRIDVSIIPAYVNHIENLLNKKAGLICIDYLALLKNKTFEREEYLRLTDNMIKIKEYAKVLNIPAIVLSQVNRFEMKTNERISLYGGKGSGEVENSSDIVLSLEKSKDYKPKENIDYLELSVLKNRRGGLGKMIIEFDRYSLRMIESIMNYIDDTKQKPVQERSREVLETF